MIDFAWGVLFIVGLVVWCWSQEWVGGRGRKLDILLDQSIDRPTHPHTCRKNATMKAASMADKPHTVARNRITGPPCPAGITLWRGAALFVLLLPLPLLAGWGDVWPMAWLAGAGARRCFCDIVVYCCMNGLAVPERQPAVAVAESLRFRFCSGGFVGMCVCNEGTYHLSISSISTGVCVRPDPTTMAPHTGRRMKSLPV